MDLKYKFNNAPRDEIDNEIGEYLVKCTDWILTASDGVTQGCTYDFSGDKVFTFIVNYVIDPAPDYRLEDEIRNNSTTPWNIKFADSDEKFLDRTIRICTYETYGLLTPIWVRLNCDFIRVEASRDADGSPRISSGSIIAELYCDARMGPPSSDAV